jgi:hypothetical protein
LYKFVNNDWGTNEGLSGTAIVSGGCGIQSGNDVNRTLVLPATTQSYSFCWDQCTANCLTTGINLSALPKAEVFPNPFYESLNIRLGADCLYRIYSLSGMLMMEGEIKFGTNRLVTTGLKSGHYIIKLAGYPPQILEKR